MRGLCGALCAPLLLLVGCADFGGPISSSVPVPPQEARLQGLEERLGDLTRRVENLDFVAQTQETQRLEAELRGLRGDVERLRYDVDTSEQRSRQLYQDLDRRIQTLENESRPTKLTLEPRLSNVPPMPANQDEEKTYLAVFDLLKSSRYDEAIAGFTTMLQTWPQGHYADNAWYWMGEAHYVKRDYPQASNNFQNLLSGFPDSPKVPDALFKLGVTQLELKQPEAAKASFQKVLSGHPDSNAAKLARQRLDSLK